MNTRLNFLYCILLVIYTTLSLLVTVFGSFFVKKNDPPSLGRGFWFFFVKKNDHPSLVHVLFISNNNTGQYCYFR